MFFIIFKKIIFKNKIEKNFIIFIMESRNSNSNSIHINQKVRIIFIFSVII